MFKKNLFRDSLQCKHKHKIEIEKSIRLSGRSEMVQCTGSHQIIEMQTVCSKKTKKSHPCERNYADRGELMDLKLQKLNS